MNGPMSMAISSFWKQEQTGMPPPAPGHFQWTSDDTSGSLYVQIVTTNGGNFNVKWPDGTISNVGSGGAAFWNEVGSPPWLCDAYANDVGDSIQGVYLDYYSINWGVTTINPNSCNDLQFISATVQNLTGTLDFSSCPSTAFHAFYANGNTQTFTLKIPTGALENVQGDNMNGDFSALINSDGTALLANSAGTTSVILPTQLISLTLDNTNIPDVLMQAQVAKLTQAVNVSITGNPFVTALDLSGFCAPMFTNQTENITLSGNAALASINITGYQGNSNTGSSAQALTDLSSNNLSATTINGIFTSLGTAYQYNTIIVTGNPGAATCDPTIATAKGWTVTT